VDALRGGDEAAFADLMRRYTAPMTSVAMLYVTSHAVAEEVVQDAWMSVVRGLDRFEGRSSLRTWIFTILANLRAQACGA
jgi:RNA polymerase sigma-70 factor, ECF subfamily